MKTEAHEDNNGLAKTSFSSRSKFEKEKVWKSLVVLKAKLPVDLLQYLERFL